jgi:hypothetical protein
MKQLLFVVLSLVAGTCFSQMSFRKELINNHCELYKITHRGEDALPYIQTEAAAQYRKLPELSMNITVFDTTKPVHNRSLKGLKYKKNDTLLIYGWDKEILLLPFHVSACKFRYSPNDSVLVFTEIQKIWVDPNASESRFYERKFKLIQQTQENFVLRDLDIYDVCREYYFKKTKITSLGKEKTKKP